MFQGVLVSDLLSKADPVTAPKLTVVRGVASYDDDDGANWIADQLVRRIRGNSSELELADLSLPLFNVVAGASNDPEERNFTPEDQFPLIYPSFKNADVVVWVAHESAGSLDYNTARLLSRLCDFKRQKFKENGQLTLFHRCPTAVIVCGGSGAYNAGLTLAGAANKLGMTLVEHGIIFWGRKQGNPMKSDMLVDTIEKLGDDLQDLCKVMRR